MDLHQNWGLKPVGNCTVLTYFERKKKKKEKKGHTLIYAPFYLRSLFIDDCHHMVYVYRKHPSEHGLWQLPNQSFVLHLCRMIWREWFQHFVTIMVWINNIVWIWYFVVIWCVKSIKQRLVQLRKNSFLVIIIVDFFFPKAMSISLLQNFFQRRSEHIVT